MFLFFFFSKIKMIIQIVIKCEIGFHETRKKLTVKLHFSLENLKFTKRFSSAKQI